MAKEKVFLASELLVLAKSLEELLFGKDNLLSKKYIIVPSKEIKEWLLKYFAKNQKAPLGLEFILVDELGSFLAKWLFPEALLPSFFELNLSLKKIVHDKGIDTPNKSVFDTFGPKSERFFLEELTHLFTLYGIYLEKWEGWQGKIWSESGWSTPFVEFQKYYQGIKNESIQFDEKSSFYLFAIPYLPPLLRELLRVLARKCDVFHLFFSPCVYFWEDLLSDLEKKRLRKRLKSENLLLEWESYLKEQNPLLANWGHLLREYLKIIEIEDLESFDLFPKPIKTNNETFLKTIQKDLLFLIQKEKPINLPQDLGSLQIHSASSKRREVEILHFELLKLLQTQEDLKLSDIAIYAPKIEEYAPYIKLVFEGSLPYRLREEEKSFFLEGLIAFLELMEGRFTKEELFNLLKNPSFQKAHQYIEEERLIWRDWFERLKTNFSLDESHFEKLFGVKWPYQSFEYGISRLITSLACGFTNETLPLLPGLTIGDAETLEKFLEIFQALKKEYLFLEKKPQLSLKEWSFYLEKWVKANLALLDEKEEQALLAFERFIFELRSARVDGNFVLQDLIYELKKELCKVSILIGGAENELLVFASLPKVVSPHKVICFLGLNDSFPVFEPWPSYALFDQIYVPNKRDEELFVFLQALLTVGKVFYLSCVNRAEDGERAEGSLVLQEFCRYLDENYLMENKKISELIWHEDAFNLNLQSSKKSQSLVSLEVNREQKLPEEINLQDLFLLARNPLRFHFEKVLKFSLNDFSRFSFKQWTNEFFELNALDLYWLRERGRKEEIENLFLEMEKSGSFPPGVMQGLIRRRVQKEIQNYRSNLEILGLTESDFGRVEFRSDVQKLEDGQDKNGHFYLAPPLEYELNGQKIKLTGNLKQISSQGLIVHAIDSFSNRLRFWPQLLIFLSFNQEHRLFQEKLFFTKKAAQLNLVVSDLKKAFGFYCEYYRQALGSFTYMYKGWERPLLEGDLEALQKVLKNSYLTKEKDPYLNWILTHFQLDGPAEIITQKRASLKPLFEPFLEFCERCKF